MYVRYDDEVKIVRLACGSYAAVSLETDKHEEELLCTFEHLSDIEPFLKGFFTDLSETDSKTAFLTSEANKT